MVNLIDASNFSGVIITIFDTAYIILFIRYIYLYKEYVLGNGKKVK